MRHRLDILAFPLHRLEGKVPGEIAKILGLEVFLKNMVKLQPEVVDFQEEIREDFNSLFSAPSLNISQLKDFQSIIGDKYGLDEGRMPGFLYQNTLEFNEDIAVFRDIALQLGYSALPCSYLGFWLVDHSSSLKWYQKYHHLPLRNLCGCEELSLVLPQGKKNEQKEEVTRAYARSAPYLKQEITFYRDKGFDVFFRSYLE